MSSTFAGSRIPCESVGSSDAHSDSGIKVGPSMQPDELVRILDSKLPGLTSTDRAVVNPERIPGKVTLIGRYGAEKVR